LHAPLELAHRSCGRECTPSDRSTARTLVFSVAHDDRIDSTTSFELTLLAHGMEEIDQRAGRRTN
jgi:hypothetical protein